MSNDRIKRDVISFFMLTLLITWVLWMPSVLNAMGYKVPTVFLIVSMMAGFTPSIIGLLMIRKSKDHFKEEVKRLLNLDFNKMWLIGIPLFFFVVAFLTYQMTVMLLDNFEPINKLPLAMTPLVFIQILLIGGALGEEFGWRGFAQAKMESLMHPLIATLILGAIWSLWHLPLFFMEGTVQSSMPIWQFLVQNTLMAYFYTWLYHKSEGNLILMIYLHAVANTAAAIFPYWQVNAGRLIGFAILLISCVALYVISPVNWKKVIIHEGSNR